MSWREKTLPASFRGVGFELESSDRQDGRKKVVLDIPGGDTPFVQDLGAASQVVRVEGFVLGGDYLRRRDALLRALRAPGQGELTHPYYGTRPASVVRVSVNESTAERGIARFSIEFVLEAREVAIAAVEDVAESVGAAADAVRGAAADSVAAQIDARPTNVTLAAARSTSGDVSEAFGELVRTQSRQLDVASDPSRVAALIRQAEELGDLVLRNGRDWAVWLQALQTGYDTFGSGARWRVDAFRGLLGFVRTLLTLGSDDLGDVVAIPSAASALAEAAEQASEVGTGWDSRQEAIRAREDLLEVTRDVLDRADDTVTAALLDLRAAVVDAVPDPAVDLPELGRYVPPDTEPALVASARLYGTPERADEIAARNGVRHPGFLPARQELEVLVDV